MIKASITMGMLFALMATAADAGAPCSNRVDPAIAGSVPTILRDLATAWQSGFTRTHNRQPLTFIEPFGPPQGSLNSSLERFLEGGADFAFLTREISEADLATFRRRYGGEPIVVPVAGGAWDKFGYVDAVAIIVNDANPVRRLTLRQIDAVFSTSRWRGGRENDWGALGVPHWRGRTVHITGGGAWSGEESARSLTIRRHVLSVGARRGIWRAAPDSGSEADVVARVASDPLAIGFTGVGHVRAGVHVVALALNERTQAYLPTENNVAAGRYPLARTVDLLLPPPGACRHRAGLNLARYLLSKAGQGTVGATGPFLPLTSKQRRASLLLLSR